MMRKAWILVALLIFTAASVRAADWRKRAEESPLDCAFYTLLQDDGRRRTDVESVAQGYFELGRYADVFAAIGLLKDQDDQAALFNVFSTLLLTENKKSEANRFLTEAVKRLSVKDYPDERVLVQIVENLIELDRADEAMNIARTFAGELEDNDVSLAIAAKLIKIGQTEKARVFVARPFFRHASESLEARAKAALIYAKLKQADRAREMLEELKQTAFSGANEMEIGNRRRRVLPVLIDVHLELGEIEKAFELWNRHGDREDFYEFARFADDLVLYGQTEKALPLLVEMRADKEQMSRDGSSIVKSYLKIGDVETAVVVAKSISGDDDNSAQQSAFMALADYFVAGGRTDAALDMLDFAFRRAAKIVFAHEPMQSIGASAGSLKIIYLRNIFERLLKLRRFEKAFEVINATGSDHWMAKEFIVESLHAFIKPQIKTLPRKQIDALLRRIQTTFTAADEYYGINAKLLAADVYAQLGEKRKAVELLARVLEEGRESCCYEDHFLIAAGIVFERNRLKADANIRKALLEFLE